MDQLLVSLASGQIEEDAFITTFRQLIKNPGFKVPHPAWKKTVQSYASACSQSEDVILMLAGLCQNLDQTFDGPESCADSTRLDHGSFLGWFKLGIFRTYISKAVFSKEVIDLCYKWKLLDPESYGIVHLKHSTFIARTLEVVGKSLSSTKGSISLPNGFTKEIQSFLYSSDSLLLQKAKEVLVWAMILNEDMATFSAILGLSGTIKIKYQVLSSLFETATQLVAKNSELRIPAWNVEEALLLEAKELASNDRGIAPSICDFFISAMNCSAVVLQDKAHILGLLMRVDQHYKPQLAKYLLPRLISSSPLMVKELGATYKVIPGNQDSLETYVLLCLTASVEFGGMPDIDPDLLLSALESDNDEIRLGAFGCVCRAFGPNKLISKNFLSLISTFIRHLELDSTPNLRQKALVSIQALFQSVFSRVYSLFRQIYRSEGGIKADFEIELSLVTSWINGLLTDLLGSLDVQHYHQFSCVDFALSIFAELGKAITQRTKSKGLREITKHDAEVDTWISGIVDEVFAENVALIIKGIVHNSFDSNRRLAKAVLKSLGLTDHCQQYKEEALDLLKCPREIISDGAALLLSCMVPIRIEEYVVILKRQLGLARENIVMASDQDNLNGTLSFLALVFPEVSSEITPALFVELCDLFMEIGNAMVKLASQPSPEGSDVTEYLVEAEAEISDSTSKAVLTFSWRAIKESTNCLSALFVAKGVDDLALFKPVVSHLVKLILTLRHPGAFCSIEDPLRTMCSLLFAKPELVAFPLEILQQSVQDCLIQPEIQVTRRSAGLPICLSAILTAAATSNGNRKLALDKIMSIPTEPMLQLMADLDLADPNPSPTYIHALNILRSFFKNARLDALTEPYVTRSFVLCFKCFTSASWSVRNGGMMLFGSLMRRVFGSVISKDHTAALGSQLDARQLALKFPNLIPAIDEQLCTAQESAQLFPILSVLQRVKFSSGAISSFPDLFNKTFAFLTTKCMGNPAANIRSMASRLIFQSLLPNCPEVVRPLLAAHLWPLTPQCSANELSSKLHLLVAIYDEKLAVHLNRDVKLIEALWNNPRLPSAIRYPALLLWKKMNQVADITLVFENENEPYKYELLRTGNTTDTKHSWLGLENRLETQNPTRSLVAKLANLKISRDTPEAVFNFFKRLPFGLKAAFLSQILPEEDELVRLILRGYERNPVIIQACLELLLQGGHTAEFLVSASRYMDPEAKYSDVIRMAVVKSLPAQYVIDSMASFALFRFTLTDDDEEVRFTALGLVSGYLGCQGKSLPFVLEALHRHVRTAVPTEYAQWRATALLAGSEPCVDSSVLFAAEPFNLFVNPAWEASIQ